MAEVDASSIPLVEVPAVEGLPAEDARAWALQATLMARLPQVGRLCLLVALPAFVCCAWAARHWRAVLACSPPALSPASLPPAHQACATAFRAIDADAQRRWPARGGTTATLAIVCGWELLVANVGDSCAYLDTGNEVLQVSAEGASRKLLSNSHHQVLPMPPCAAPLRAAPVPLIHTLRPSLSLAPARQVSATHRLEDNRGEVERCQAAGSEIAPSSLEGKPVGPIRCVPA